MNLDKLNKLLISHLFSGYLNKNLYFKEMYLFVVESDEENIEVAVPTNKNQILYFNNNFGEYRSDKIAGSQYYRVDETGELKYLETYQLVNEKGEILGPEIEWTYIYYNESKHILDGVIARAWDGREYVVRQNGSIERNYDD